MPRWLGVKVLKILYFWFAALMAAVACAETWHIPSIIPSFCTAHLIWADVSSAVTVCLLSNILLFRNEKEDEKYFPCKPAFCLDQTLSWSVESWIDNLQCFTVAQHFHITIIFLFFYPCRRTRPWSGPSRRQNCHSPSFLSFICLVLCQSPLRMSGELLGSRQELEPDLVFILFLLLFAVKTNQ